MTDGETPIIGPLVNYMLDVLAPGSRQTGLTMHKDVASWWAQYARKDQFPNRRQDWMDEVVAETYPDFDTKRMIEHITAKGDVLKFPLCHAPDEVIPVPVPVVMDGDLKLPADNAKNESATTTKPVRPRGRPTAPVRSAPDKRAKPSPPARTKPVPAKKPERSDASVASAESVVPRGRTERKARTCTLRTRPAGVAKAPSAGTGKCPERSVKLLQKAGGNGKSKGPDRKDPAPRAPEPVALSSAPPVAPPKFPLWEELQKMSKEKWPLMHPKDVSVASYSAAEPFIFGSTLVPPEAKE